MTPLEIMWTVFAVTATALFVADIKLSAGRAHEIGRKEAMLLCAFWILVASVFGVLTGYMLGFDRMVEFFTAYTIEYSLSMDNMFVFIMIFSYFGVPKKYQPKILTWGILGAVFMRLILIFAGVGLINRFHWLIYVFGAVLILTAIKMLVHKDGEMDPGKNPLLRLLGKIMPIDKEASGGEFFVKKAVWHATPLFATLVVIETTDLVFAVDSIPAVLAISREPFIVYTSNVFAVVGLRSLYFLLASVMDLFRFLKFGIAVILFYVGVKMTISGYYKIDPLISLGVVLGILAAAILMSVLIKPEPAEPKA
ncbi:MAG TPA: tellurium resistance protein TerC [Elusimicrobia bacterium]|nr:MAG: tellurium resistance protein TerC [Elusimicrobia bacterium GWA2_64_40]HAN03799.1 tellurium resistance protein TerC [Elusimicrobiota bacterium]HAU90638.1 tellurium resistance protein TerC [Elusimicrobiota bacterium]